MRRILAPLALLLTLIAAPALAQIYPPTVNTGHGYVQATPIVNVGYDSNTGLPCIVGSTVTCSLQGSGGGGGNFVGTVGGTPPTSASYTGFTDNSGVFQGVTFTTPMPIICTAGCSLSASLSALANAAAPSYSEGSSNPLSSDRHGSIRITILDASGNPIDYTVATPVNGSVSVHGETASGSTLTENPLANGCKGLGALPTAVTDAQKVGVSCSLEGAVWTETPEALRLRGAVSVTDTTQTSVTGMTAQGANIKIYVKSGQCFRTDAGATLISVALNDGATTSIGVPAGGEAIVTYAEPLVVAANTDLKITTSASTNAVKCYFQGRKGS